MVFYAMMYEIFSILFCSAGNKSKKRHKFLTGTAEPVSDQ